MITNDSNSNFTMSLGVVKNNADPAQHGRLQVFIPAIDNKDFQVEDLPWALYVSPFGGTTANFSVGRNNDVVPGASSYGFWAIPKTGAQVLVGYLEGDHNVRFWMGCMYIPELNRTLPSAINNPPNSSEIDESGVYPQTTMSHAQDAQNEAGLGPNSDHFKTRGGWERSVSYPENKTANKPTTDGYAPKPLESNKSDSQIHSFTTPGRHFWTMSDVQDHCRIRMKTTAGSQIILDDTNERIYISSARGRNYIEIDEGSGKVYHYAAGKLSFHSENDINFYSDQNINMVAKKRVNIQSEERGVKIQSEMSTSILSESGNVNVTASRDINLKTTGGGSAGAVSESQTCSSPPYSGGGIGSLQDYAEEAGSGTSSVKINASDSVHIRADSGSIMATAMNTLEFRSMGPGILLTGGTITNTSEVFEITAGSFNTTVGSFGFVASPDDPIITLGDASGQTAGTADSAGTVDSDDIKGTMIVPLHEPWTRDEDEANCSTPRNRSYQG